MGSPGSVDADAIGSGVLAAAPGPMPVCAPALTLVLSPRSALECRYFIPTRTAALAAAATRRTAKARLAGATFGLRRDARAAKNLARARRSSASLGFMPVQTSATRRACSTAPRQLAQPSTWTRLAPERQPPWRTASSTRDATDGSAQG